EPVKHEPLPDMKVERESFSEAWARHRSIMDAAKHEAFVAQPVEDDLAESDDHEHDRAEHDEIREEPTMRNPFASRKPVPEPDKAEPFGIEEVGVARAAEMLIAGGATRAIF